MKENISRIMENNNISIEYIFLGSIVMWVVLTLLIFILCIKQHNLKKRYKIFMMRSDGKSLESSIHEEINDLDNFKNEFDTVENRVKTLEHNILNSFQKVGIVKYDAFSEMGGKLSFALALLTSNNDGIVINSVHSREGCYNYIKEVKNGESLTTDLIAEERDAVKQAIDKKI